MTDHREIVERFQKAMSVQHDADAAAQIYAKDVTATDFTMPLAPAKGRQAKQEYLATFLRAFPDLSFETRNVFGSGDWFVAEITTRGTHTGPCKPDPRPSSRLPAGGWRCRSAGSAAWTSKGSATSGSTTTPQTSSPSSA